MSKLNVAKNVANEAVDTMQCSREYLLWLSALGKAIHDDLATGSGHIAKDLAGLVQFLADDHCNVLDSQITQSNSQLESIDLRV